ncbi:MAG: ABC transporter ATP-binding protein [Promethearchaeota archaeon]
MARNAIIIGKELSKDYLRGKKEIVKAIHRVDVQLNEGELVCVLGPSGSGKSTLLNVLSGIDKPTSGRVLFDDENIVDWEEEDLSKFRLKNVGFVFQTWELIPTFNALENVEIPLVPGKVKAGEMRRRSLSLLKQVGLYDRIDHFPSELSGGEQQRVAIARALINEPRVLFADEPTGNLDEDTGNSILRLLKRISREGTAIMIATHNQALTSFADKVVKLRAGKVMD